MNCTNFTSPELAVVVDNPSTLYLYRSIGVHSSKDCRRLGLLAEMKNTHKLRVVSCRVFFVLPEPELQPQGEPQQSTTCTIDFDQFRTINEPVKNA